MNRARWLLLALAGLAVGSPLSADDDDTGWNGEVAFLAGHHDNFFFRGGDSPAPSSDLVTLRGAAELEKETGAGDFTLALDGAGVFVRDIDDADYQLAGVTAQLKRGPTRYSARVSTALNRLFSEEGDAVFFDLTSLELQVRHSLTPRIWIRGEVELEQWDFDPAENDRDSDVVGLAVTARFGLTDRVAVRGSLLYEDREADGPRNSRTGQGVSVGLEAQPSDRVSVFLRVRRRERDYEEAPPGDRNFRRDDTVDDLVLNVRWRVGERWGLLFEEAFREGDSTRPDRNFDGNQLNVGLFWSF